MNDRGQSGRSEPVVPPVPEAEVDDELAFHLEHRIQENIDRGMTADAARKAALERFGNVAVVREECAQLLTEDRKAAARRDWLDDLRQDLRFAVRSAIRAPLFTLLAIVTLAFGIGANAAVFGVVKSVLLNTLPYREAGDLMRIYSPIRKEVASRGSLSAGTISDTRERAHSFESLAAFLPPRDAVYHGDDAATVMQLVWTEPALFRTLGVSMVRGRTFTDEDATRDTTISTVISYAMWQGVLGGDSAVIGRTIRLNGIDRSVIGVLPRNFVPPEGKADFYLPMSMAPYMNNPRSVRGSHPFAMVGRLKSGVSAEAANRELNTIGTALEQLYAKDNLGIGLMAKPMRDAMVGDTRAPLLVLLASAALVLLITCANLAGALLSRTISRRKEFAVRIAIGAGRDRLVRQLLTESLLLAVAGGLAGLMLAILGLALVRGLALGSLPTYADLSLDAGAIMVTFALALITGLIFGVGPALSVSRGSPQGTLRDQTRGSSESRRARQTRGVLVAGQMALCVSLLASAGLLARSLAAMTSAEVGFNPDNLLTFTVQLPNARYNSAMSRVVMHDQFEEQLRAIPGVKDVAITTELPTAIENSSSLYIQDAPWPANEAVPFVTIAGASDNYFGTLNVPLKEGRLFASTDVLGGAPVMVINEAMAKRYWPKGNALGAQIHVGPPNPDAPWITVIGIVGDIRNHLTELTPEPMMFEPLRQQPFADLYLVRATGEPMAILTAVKRALAAIDPALPTHHVTTMDAVIDAGFATRRLPVVLMIAFGALALLLASVGVYAMFASMTAAREREFGVRIALGSTRGAIAALVLRQGGVWMAIGLAIGMLGVVAAARLLRTQLYGVPQFDPVAIGLAVLILLLCAGIALLVPVRRASQADPIKVLR